MGLCGVGFLSLRLVPSEGELRLVPRKKLHADLPRFANRIGQMEAARRQRNRRPAPRLSFS